MTVYLRWGAHTNLITASESAIYENSERRNNGLQLALYHDDEIAFFVSDHITPRRHSVPVPDPTPF